VAEIYQQVDRRIRQILSAALTALSPSGASAESIEVMTEHILRLGVGAVCRRITTGQYCTDQNDRIVENAIFNDLEHLLLKHDQYSVGIGVHGGWCI